MYKKWFWKLFLASRPNLRRLIKTYDYMNKNVFDVEKYVISEVKKRFKEIMDRPDMKLVDNSYKGQNLPFNIHNHRLLAIKMTIFLAIPFSMPFLIVRYHLLKASGGGPQPKAEEFDPFIHTNVMI